ISVLEGGGTTNPFYNAIAMPPIWSPVDENDEPIFYGNTLLDPWDWNFAFFVNPLHAFKATSETRKIRNLSTLYAEIDLLKNLQVRSEFHNEIRMNEDKDFIPNSLPTTSQKFSRSNATSNK